jgi:signal transduction histidine kinase
MSFSQQLLTLLTTSPGNLAYHLVMAFTLMGVLVLSINQWRANRSSEERRMVVGLALLLGGRMALFLLSTLSLTGWSNLQNALPPLDRAVTAFSLGVILWLWAFPHPNKVADLVSSLGGIALFIATLLSWVIWVGSQPSAGFNAFWISRGWEWLSLWLVVAGSGLLVTRKPADWGMGVSMLGIAGVGHIIQLLAPDLSADFAAPVRLTQLAAYPLLFTLPQRFWPPLLAQADEFSSHHPASSRKRYDTEPDTLMAFLSLWSEHEPKGLCQAITRSVAHIMLADICLLLSSPNERGEMIFDCAYDLIRETYLPGGSLSVERLPVLSEAIRKQHPLRLPASSTTPDLLTLAHALEIDRSGHMLTVPIVSPHHPPLGTLVLLSPYSNRYWSVEDEEHLLRITQALGRIITSDESPPHQPSSDGQNLEELERLHAQLEKAHAEVQQLKSENHLLLNELAALREELIQEEDTADLQGKNHFAEKIARLEGELQDLQEKTQATIAELCSENERLQKLAKETGLVSLPLRPEHASAQHWISMINLVQELRQPMSSIVGYTDFLLSESVGILGNLQRKFLERVKASTERMNRMIEDLLQVVAMESGKPLLNLEKVDLSLAIDEAISKTSPQLREKNIILRMDIPESLPPVQGDREALNQILNHLLHNAEEVTPHQGEIAIAARPERYGNAHEYVLIQISDSGGGIPPEELPNVFDPDLNDKKSIQGVGNTPVGLAVTKKLVEAHGGRIWVDSRLGSGATFSVLLPTQPSPDINPKQAGE